MPADEFHVILVPGADGLAFAQDAAQAAERGAAVHSLTLPAFAGHPVDGQAAFYADAADFDGVVLIGAIPSLSDFRIHGDHSSARRFRAALGGDTSRIGLIEPLDLFASLRTIDPRICLLQVGRDDP